MSTLSNSSSHLEKNKLLSEIESLGATPNPPATDLIRELLKFHKAEAKYERNTHLSVEAFRRSRSVFEAINKLVADIDQSDEPDYHCWEKYTSAIPPLEDILLEFCFSKPDKSRNHVPDEEVDLQTALTCIYVWSEDRTMLKRVLARLAQDTRLCLTEEVARFITSAYHDKWVKDDEATALALVTKLREQDIHHKSAEKYLSEIRAGALSIFHKLKGRPSEACYDLTIRSFMLLTIVFALFDKRRASKASRSLEELREQVANGGIWELMKSLIHSILVVLDSRVGQAQDADIAKWQKEFDGIQTMLLEVGSSHISTAKEMLELIKLSGHTRRPFHGRAVGLIRILRVLDEHSVKQGSSPGSRRELKRTMRAAIDQLKLTAGAVTDVKTILLSGQVYQSQAEAMAKLVLKVKETTVSLNLSGIWNNAATFFDEGVKVDEKHLRRMREVFMHAPS